jgi:hypothetical protein
MATRKPRSQPYRVTWPLNAQQAENIDGMFQILFDDIRNGALSVDVATQTTGTLPPTSGGTGLDSFAVGDIIYASAVDTLSALALGASGRVLRSNGTTPAWSAWTTPASFTAGSVLFADATNSIGQDNDNFYYDSSLQLWGFGTNTPEFGIDIADGLRLGKDGPVGGTTLLDGSITDSDTTITVDSTDGFSTKGVILIENEFIWFTGKTATTFTGCTRGRNDTVAAAHADNVAVIYITLFSTRNDTEKCIAFASAGRLYVGVGDIHEVPSASSISNLKITLGSQAFTVGGTYGVSYGDPSGVQSFFGTSGSAAYFGSPSAHPVEIRTSNLQRLYITDTMVQFLGTTSSFPALKRNAAVLDVKLADDSDYANLKAKELVVSSGTVMMRSSAAFTNGAAAAVGTLNNAPAAGDPTKWIAIDDNGTTRYIPAW